MAVNSVQGTSRLSSNDFQYKELTDEQLKARLSLYTGDSVEAAPLTLKLDNGGTLSMPTGDSQKRQEMGDILRALSEEGQTALLQAGNQVAQGLAQATAQMQSSNGAFLAGNVPPGLSNDIAAALGATPSAQSGDTNAALTEVLTVTMTMSESEIAEFATQLRGKLQEKSNLREQIGRWRVEAADIQEQLAAMNNANSDHKYAVDIGPEGNQTTKMMTKGEAEAYVKELENKQKDGESTLETLSEMTQMDTMKLQEMMQDQARIMQLLSSIMKMNHDTLKDTIQKIN